jgi:hypothetical protein
LPPFVSPQSHQPPTRYSLGLMAFLFRKLPIEDSQVKKQKILTFQNWLG